MGKILIEVTGESMAPYLITRDLVLACTDQTNRAKGQLVLARRMDSRELFVHRIVEVTRASRVFRIKGDRNKYFDDELGGPIEIVGSVVGRLHRAKDGNLRLVDYQRHTIRILQHAQAALSYFNRWRIAGIHRIASISLRTINSLARAFENKIPPEDRNWINAP